MTGQLPVLLFDGRTLLFGSPSIPYKTVVLFSTMLVLFYFLILMKYALFQFISNTTTSVKPCLIISDT